MHPLESLIPGIFGILMILFPRWFTKAQGDAYEKAKRKFRALGALLILIGILYFVIGTIQQALPQQS